MPRSVLQDGMEGSLAKTGRGEFGERGRGATVSRDSGFRRNDIGGESLLDDIASLMPQGVTQIPLPLIEGISLHQRSSVVAFSAL